MIKVCILSSVHPTFDIRIFHKEAKSLKKAGYDVTLIVQHDKDEIVDDIRIVPLPKPRRRVVRMTKTSYQVYRKALEIDADIYHFHDPELIPVGLLLKRYGKRVIYDVHEDAPRQNMSKAYIPLAFRRPISIAIEILEGLSAKHFDGVITATPFINNRFAELGVYAINVNNYPIVSELYDDVKQWEEREKIVCYVGVISRIRGAFEMVDAIGKTDCELLLAGKIYADVEMKLKQLHGWKRVKALGLIGREEIKIAMARCVAGMVIFHPAPNHIDSQPNKMFEYMSAGIPVIASNFQLWKEIIEGNECGFCVNPFNTSEIADAITYIIDHPAEARAMGRRGQKAVEEKYNWSIEEKKLLALYDKMK